MNPLLQAYGHESHQFYCTAYDRKGEPLGYGSGVTPAEAKKAARLHVRLLRNSERAIKELRVNRVVDETQAATAQS